MRIGIESRKTYEDKLTNGFFQKYMSGRGCEIGYKGGDRDAQTILPDCDGYDKDHDGYDGLHIPVSDGHYNWLYSSHCLEHIQNYEETIKEWFRVVKHGGHIVTVVPHRDLYEKKFTLPSRWNPDHKRFYTPASLLIEFENSLPVNSFRVRHMQDNDAGHNYNCKPEDPPAWGYEIELVIQKI